MSKIKVKSDPIPSEENSRIWEFYAPRIAGGYTYKRLSEMYNTEYGTNYAESSLRTRYQMYDRDVDLNNDDELALAKREINLRKNQRRATSMRSVAMSMTRELAEQEILADAILEVFSHPAENKPKEFFEVDKVYDKNEIPMYSFSDTHYGYKYSSREFSYDVDIANRRLDYIVDFIITDARKHGYKHIYVTDNGDQIEGSALRVSQLTTLALNMVEQVKEYSDQFVKMVKKLSNELPDVKITVAMVTEDNHAQLRLFRTQRDELPENMALLIASNVNSVVSTAHEFGQMENIEFIYGGEIVINVDNKKPFNVLLAHGHQYGRKDDIIDKGGVRHGKTIHLYVGGHWHNYSMKHKLVKDGGQQSLLFLPSVVGDTDFSERLFLSNYPGFTKIVIDLEDRMTHSKVIRLDNLINR